MHETLKKDWDETLPMFLFACRDVPSEATGFSFFQLLYRQHMHSPLDVLRNQWIPSSKMPKLVVE